MKSLGPVSTAVQVLLFKMKWAKSPLLRFDDRIMIKHEGLGMSGSHKGRSASWLWEERLRIHGTPRAIADRSSGSWAMMNSKIAGACGVPSTFVTVGEPDPTVSQLIESNGGQFKVVKTNAERRSALQHLINQGMWCPDQHNNVKVITAFRETLGRETADDLLSAGVAPQQLRFVVASMGTGGSGAGLALGLRDAGYSSFELVGCDSTTSIVGGQVAQTPLKITVPGVGSSDEICRTFREASKHLNRPLVRVSPLVAAEAAAAFKKVVPRGCGMSSGLALAAAQSLLTSELRPGELILILFADDAARYAMQIQLGDL